VEVLWSWAFGKDAKLAIKGQGRPLMATNGTAPERGKFCAAKPACRVRFLFGYSSLCANKEKVTRRKGERVTKEIQQSQLSASVQT